MAIANYELKSVSIGDNHRVEPFQQHGTKAWKLFRGDKLIGHYSLVTGSYEFFFEQQEVVSIKEALSMAIRTGFSVIHNLNETLTRTV